MGQQRPRLLADRFELLEEVGRGGAGLVYRAHDHRLDRVVAVKLLTDIGDTALERFRREAATAARIQHPNVVALHDAGVDGDTPFLVMRLIEGPSLADRIAEEGPLDPGHARRLGRDLLAGLEATHRAGVLHRDLTPRNVLFDADGHALLADFGIARGTEDNTLTAAHTVVGTRPFLAPERLRGHAATVVSDLFAVGVTLQCAITGRHDVPVPPDHPMAPLITACTAPRPEGRPASAQAALDRLIALGGADDLPDTEALQTDPGATEVVASQESAVPSSTTPTPGGTAPSDGDHGRPHPDRRRTIVLTAVAAVALVGALAAYGTRDSSPSTPATPDATPGASATDGAPTYDPSDPAGSARELAEWLRQQD